MAQDTFDPVDTATRVPQKPRKLEVVLTVEVDEQGLNPQYSARYSFDIKDQNGANMDVREGNLVPHLTAQERAGATNWMDDRLAQARAVVPDPV